MKRNILLLVALIGFIVMAFTLLSGPLMAQQLTDEEQLGKFIFLTLIFRSTKINPVQHAMPQRLDGPDLFR
jgi:hypothetical protein